MSAAIPTDYAVEGPWTKPYSTNFPRRSNYHWTMWHLIVCLLLSVDLVKVFPTHLCNLVPFRVGSSCLSLPSSCAWGLESSPIELYVTIPLWSLFLTFQFSFFLYTESNFHSCWNSPFSGLKRCWISNNINILWGQRYVVGNRQGQDEEGTARRDMQVRAIAKRGMYKFHQLFFTIQTWSLAWWPPPNFPVAKGVDEEEQTLLVVLCWWESMRGPGEPKPPHFTMLKSTRRIPPRLVLGFW